MNPERWQQVDRLLEQALEREPGKRAQFLDKTCAGNVELRQEVEALLKAHEQARSFIETPALNVTAKGLAVHRMESLVGQQLGNYKILSLLGAGGMGDVSGTGLQARPENTLLFVDLRGLPQVLWRQPSFIPWTAGGTWGIPSPDGRYVAFLASTLSGNAWMLENF